MTDARERLRDAKDAVYRTALLEAAELTFAEQGYEAAKVTDIAARAGLSLATLYKLFPGKADLHQAVHQLRTSEILRDSLDGLPQGEGALALLEHGVLAYVRYQLANPGYLRLTLREGATWTMRQSMHLPEQLDAWDQGFAMAEQTFAAGVAAGEFVDEPPALHARHMIALLQVLLGVWLDDGMAEPPEDVVARARRLLVRAFATPHAREAWTARTGASL